MNYILVISLSGSGMLLLYFCQKFTIGRKLSKGWHYLFLKAVMLYYLIPLPWLGMFYRNAIKNILQEFPLEYLYFYHGEKVLYQAGNEFAISTGYQHRLYQAGFWWLAAFLAFAVQLANYIRAYRRIRQCGSRGKITEDRTVLERKKEELRIKRRVALYACDSENAAFTVGIWKPAIVCFLPDDPLEKELLLAHELVHIKRLDLLWKIAGAAVLCLNWFNPFVYLFLREFNQVCEESCDEMAVEKCGEEERYQYAIMIVKRSKQQENMKGWKAALTKDANRVKERVDLIMECGNKKSKWNGIAAAALGLVMVALNSVTVLAYEEVKVVQGSSEEELKGVWVQNVDITITPGEEPIQDEWRDIIQYDKQFVDEAGNIYPVIESVDVYSNCSHVYVSGTYEEHKKNKDGSCELKRFESQRCSKCGHCIIGKLIMTLLFPECIH